jgi:hypothetical protein
MTSRSRVSGSVGSVSTGERFSVVIVVHGPCLLAAYW